MMKHEVQMFLQYEVHPADLNLFKSTIEKIAALLPVYEATDISFVYSGAEHEPSFVTETCSLPTEAHYFALKKLRSSCGHSAFGCLDSFIPGGLEEIRFWALKKKL
ncbi:hypothetical protein [Bacillus infantis]|uniref:hypothetical protein n=1 Tax=Bacillus infantis TaxID=324767 RepID=UPI003CF0218E